MINFGLNLDSVKSSFFDMPKVMRAVDKATRKQLSRAGAFIRQSAQGLIRSKKGVSSPGRPPHSHTGVLKKFLFFSYEARQQSVVVGPVLTNQLFVSEGGFVRGTVPQVLEYGGTIGIFEVFKWGKWRRADLRSRRRNAGLATRVRNVEIKARPYMGPALEMNAEKFPSLFHDSIKSNAA